MDKRWKLSSFFGLPRDFVLFAKRLDLYYDKKKEVLRDRNDEPVAWLVNKPKKALTGDILSVEMWHVDGPVQMSFKELSAIRSKDALIEFQTTSKNLAIPTVSLRGVFEDTKERLARAGEAIGNENINQVLKEFGTVGREDMLEPRGPGFAMKNFPAISDEISKKKNLIENSDRRSKPKTAKA